MKAQVKILGPVHESLLQVTYASSEGSGERAHSYNIGYLKTTRRREWQTATSWLVGTVLPAKSDSDFMFCL